MQDATTTPPPPAYPVRLSMEYPERLSRLSTLFRIVLAIPALLFLYLIQNGPLFAMWAAILVRGRIPRWLFDFQVGLNRFTNRAAAYFALLTDKYPALDGDWVLQYSVEYPARISRWRLVIWKTITVLPHLIVLFFLYLAASVVVFIAWFAILIGGTYPRGLHGFVVGVLRWQARVTAYAVSLTDAFPPYSLDDEAEPASSQAVVASAIGGLVIFALTAAAIAGIARLAYVYSNETKGVELSYDVALAGDVGGLDASIALDGARFTLLGGDDPADLNDLEARTSHRLVEFRLLYTNERLLRYGTRDQAKIERDTLRLRSRDEGSIDPVLLTVDGAAAPGRVAPGSLVTLRAIFEVPEDDHVLELRGYPDAGTGRHVAWRFR